MLLIAFVGLLLTLTGLGVVVILPDLCEILCGICGWREHPLVTKARRL